VSEDPEHCVAPHAVPKPERLHGAFAVTIPSFWPTGGRVGGAVVGRVGVDRNIAAHASASGTLFGPPSRPGKPRTGWSQHTPSTQFPVLIEKPCCSWNSFIGPRMVRAIAECAGTQSASDAQLLAHEAPRRRTDHQLAD